MKMEEEKIVKQNTRTDLYITAAKLQVDPPIKPREYEREIKHT